MKSTGEVLGIGKTFEEALYKGFAAARYAPTIENPVVLMTINEQDKEEFKELALKLKKQSFVFIATSGTADSLGEMGIPAKVIHKIGEASPNVMDVLLSGEVNLIVNTPTKGNDSKRDGFIMRRAAAERNIPGLYFFGYLQGMGYSKK